MLQHLGPHTTDALQLQLQNVQMFHCAVMSVSPWMQPVLWWCVVVFQLQFWQKIWYKLLFSPQCIVLQIGLKHSLLFHYTPATWGCWGISITFSPSSRATRLVFQETMFAMHERWCTAWAMFCALGQPGCTARLPDTLIGHVLCTWPAPMYCHWGGLPLAVP